MNGLQLKYFVLSPTKRTEYGQASIKALLAYARSIAPHNPDLARDLRAWARKEQSILDGLSRME